MIQKQNSPHRVFMAAFLAMTFIFTSVPPVGALRTQQFAETPGLEEAREQLLSTPSVDRLAPLEFGRRPVLQSSLLLGLFGASATQAADAVDLDALPTTYTSIQQLEQALSRLGDSDGEIDGVRLQGDLRLNATFSETTRRASNGTPYPVYTAEVTPVGKPLQLIVGDQERVIGVGKPLRLEVSHHGDRLRTVTRILPGQQYDSVRNLKSRRVPLVQYAKLNGFKKEGLKARLERERQASLDEGGTPPEVPTVYTDLSPASFSKWVGDWAERLTPNSDWHPEFEFPAGEGTVDAVAGEPYRQSLGGGRFSEQLFVDITLVPRGAPMMIVVNGERWWVGEHAPVTLRIGWDGIARGQRIENLHRTTTVIPRGGGVHLPQLMKPAGLQNYLRQIGDVDGTLPVKAESDGQVAVYARMLSGGVTELELVPLGSPLRLTGTDGQTYEVPVGQLVRAQLRKRPEGRSALFGFTDVQQAATPKAAGSTPMGVSTVNIGYAALTQLRAQVFEQRARVQQAVRDYRAAEPDEQAAQFLWLARAIATQLQAERTYKVQTIDYLDQAIAFFEGRADQDAVPVWEREANYVGIYRELREQAQISLRVVDHMIQMNRHYYVLGALPIPQGNQQQVTNLKTLLTAFAGEKTAEDVEAPEASDVVPETPVRWVAGPGFDGAKVPQVDTLKAITDETSKIYRAKHEHLAVDLKRLERQITEASAFLKDAEDASAAVLRSEIAILRAQQQVIEAQQGQLVALHRLNGVQFQAWANKATDRDLADAQQNLNGSILAEHNAKLEVLAQQIARQKAMIAALPEDASDGVVEPQRYALQSLEFDLKYAEYQRDWMTHRAKVGYPLSPFEQVAESDRVGAQLQSLSEVLRVRESVERAWEVQAVAINQQQKAEETVLQAKDAISAREAARRDLEAAIARARAERAQIQSRISEIQSSGGGGGGNGIPVSASNPWYHSPHQRLVRLRMRNRAMQSVAQNRSPVAVAAREQSARFGYEGHLVRLTQQWPDPAAVGFRPSLESIRESEDIQLALSMGFLPESYFARSRARGTSGSGGSAGDTSYFDRQLQRVDQGVTYFQTQLDALQQQGVPFQAAWKTAAEAARRYQSEAADRAQQNLRRAIEQFRRLSTAWVAQDIRVQDSAFDLFPMTGMVPLFTGHRAPEVDAAKAAETFEALEKRRLELEVERAKLEYQGPIYVQGESSRLARQIGQLKQQVETEWPERMKQRNPADEEGLAALQRELAEKKKRLAVLEAQQETVRAAETSARDLRLKVLQARVKGHRAESAAIAAEVASDDEALDAAFTQFDQAQLDQLKAQLAVLQREQAYWAEVQERQPAQLLAPGEDSAEDAWIEQRLEQLNYEIQGLSQEIKDAEGLGPGLEDGDVFDGRRQLLGQISILSTFVSFPGLLAVKPLVAGEKPKINVGLTPLQWPYATPEVKQVVLGTFEQKGKRVSTQVGEGVVPRRLRSARITAGDRWGRDTKSVTVNGVTYPGERIIQVSAIAEGTSKRERFYVMTSGPWERLQKAGTQTYPVVYEGPAMALTPLPMRLLAEGPSSPFDPTHGLLLYPVYEHRIENQRGVLVQVSRLLGGSVLTVPRKVYQPYQDAFPIKPLQHVPRDKHFGTFYEIGSSLPLVVHEPGPVKIRHKLVATPIRNASSGIREELQFEEAEILLDRNRRVRRDQPGQEETQLRRRAYAMSIVFHLWMLGALSVLSAPLVVGQYATDPGGVDVLSLMSLPDAERELLVDAVPLQIEIPEPVPLNLEANPALFDSAEVVALPSLEVEAPEIPEMTQVVAPDRPYGILPELPPNLDQAAFEPVVAEVAEPSNQEAPEARPSAGDPNAQQTEAEEAAPQADAAGTAKVATGQSNRQKAAPAAAAPKAKAKRPNVVVEKRPNMRWFDYPGGRITPATRALWEAIDGQRIKLYLTFEGRTGAPVRIDIADEDELSPALLKAARYYKAKIQRDAQQYQGYEHRQDYPIWKLRPWGEGTTKIGVPIRFQMEAPGREEGSVDVSLEQAPPLQTIQHPPSRVRIRQTLDWSGQRVQNVVESNQQNVLILLDARMFDPQTLAVLDDAALVSLAVQIRESIGWTGNNDLAIDLVTDANRSRFAELYAGFSIVEVRPDAVADVFLPVAGIPLVATHALMEGESVVQIDLYAYQHLWDMHYEDTLEVLSHLISA